MPITHHAKWVNHVSQEINFAIHVSQKIKIVNHVSRKHLSAPLNKMSQRHFGQEKCRHSATKCHSDILARANRPTDILARKNYRRDILAGTNYCCDILTGQNVATIFSPGQNVATLVPFWCYNNPKSTWGCCNTINGTTCCNDILYQDKISSRHYGRVKMSHR